MSNRVTIEPTEFKNVGSETDTVTFGVIVYDDYSQAYDNTWDSIPDNDFEILKKVLQSNDEVIAGLLDSVQSNSYGIYIGDWWYDWDDIKHCFR